MEKILRTIQRFVPKKIYRFFQPLYHYILATVGTVIYRNPSKSLYVVGVTGTKGKSSTTEFVNAVLEAAGMRTAILSTIRFKIGDVDRANKYKMTMPGRFFTQKFLHEAKEAGCNYAIIEMTSEGARFYRHKGVQLNALIFTGLSPEHIESHGSFENYKQAKLKLVHHLAKNTKKNTLVIANTDENKHGYSFLIHPVHKNIGFSLKDVQILEENEERSVLDYKGEIITIPLPGKFNIRNALSALIFAEENAIPLPIAKQGIEQLTRIRGRVEKIECGQPFTVVVDYAHTDDSLKKLYETFKRSRKIAVLGSTGGGRDSWKRPVLGGIADSYCSNIIITNEDPYDEDPLAIINDVARGVTNHTPIIIEDRREAIAYALREAKPLDVILITGKGTDPYIMGKNGTKLIWDDATVVREELKKLGYTN